MVLVVHVILGMWLEREQAILSNHMSSFWFDWHLSMSKDAPPYDSSQSTWSAVVTYNLDNSRGRYLGGKKTLRLCLPASNWRRKWRILHLTSWSALKRNASHLVLFVVITGCDRTSKATNITVLFWTATVNGASKDVERGTSWNNKFVFGENRWKTSETALTALHQWNRKVKLKTSC